ncbi:nickel resistance protein [Xenorhabdus mauleonii]|uniref:Nickel resistance protein n=1 Tax=Xenorhabdus mauleonii TaxID=351675 RepID=A0A1I3PK23_9GAMM|nr:MFS transporter [Xenorhabdus mauleonii]PHM44778.1 nickel resistance protein [Xenorhabdus mauleonii]SFJ21689.1 Predicted arabinose efflux permease, MFS family [Xenorhabdus mauleonii]
MHSENTNVIIRRLSSSNLAAQFSEQMAISAIPILAVVALGVSAEQSASLQAVNTLPFLLLSIPAGLLADKYRRKHLMIGTEIIRALALFLLFFLFYTKSLGLYELAALSFAITTGTVVYSVATPALVAAVVDKDHLLTANRKLEIARSIAFTAGPSVGGVLAGWSSGIFAFLAAFILSMVSVWYLSRLPNEKRQPPSGRHVMQELSEGVRFIAHNSFLRPIVATAFIFNTSWYLLLAIFAYYAINNLHFSASAVGGTLGFFGAGMVVGAFLYPFISRYISFGRQIMLGPICAFSAALLMVGTMLVPIHFIVFIAFFLFGFGPIVWTISTTSLRQIVTPSGLIARVSSVIMTATFGARPLGAALGAWISATFSVTSCLIAVAIGFSIQLGIIALSAPSRLSSIDGLGHKEIGT